MTSNDGYLLPVVSDADRICFRVSVPNEQQHIAAFMGQLLDLGYWYNWQKDSSHFAKDVAETWRGIFDEVSDNVRLGTFLLGDCGMDVCEQIADCPPAIRMGATGLEWFNPALGLWQPLPGATNDPRTQGKVPPPWVDVPAGQTGNCLSAANILESFKSMLQVVEAEPSDTFYSIYNGRLLISTQLLAVFPNLLGLDGAIGNFSVAINSYTSGTLATEISDDQLHKINCILACSIDGDGNIGDFIFEQMMSDARDQLNATTADVFVAWSECFGRNGYMLQEKVGGIVTADCDDCDCGWTHRFDFRFEDGGFIVDPTAPHGTWVSGQGWQTELVFNGTDYSRWVQIVRSFDDRVITHLAYTFNLVKGEPFIPGLNNGTALYHGTTFLTDVHHSSEDQPDFDNEMHLGPVALTANQVLAQVFAMYWHTDVGGVAFITSLTVRGEGTDPFI